MKVDVKDARMVLVPYQGWCLIVIWARSDGRGRIVEELLYCG